MKRRKLAGFVHVTPHDSTSKTILQETLEGKRQAMDTPLHARATVNSLQQTRLEDSLRCSVIRVSPTTRQAEGLRGEASATLLVILMLTAEQQSSECLS